MGIELSIWESVLAANRAWRGGDPAGVAPLFHRDVVMEAPDGRLLCQGRDAMVRSYVDYTRAVTTLHFRETDHTVHVAGGTAVVSYGFEVTYELAGKRHDEVGRERLVFTLDDGRWSAVWRMQTSAPRSP
jgi:ketosteroid isomerase-like protein